jgi:hypothetical protein
VPLYGGMAEKAIVPFSFVLYNRRRIKMNQFEKFAIISDQISQDDPNPIVMPITRTGSQFDVPWYARNAYHWNLGQWGYVCNDNGRGCGKAFPDKASKTRHRQWCQRAQQ